MMLDIMRLWSCSGGVVVGGDVVGGVGMLEVLLLLMVLRERWLFVC